LSAYLAAGIVSPRDVLRAAYELVESKTLPGGRDSGLGFFLMEVAWRDFYQHVRPYFLSLPPSNTSTAPGHFLSPFSLPDASRLIPCSQVLAAWPRVCMSKPWNLKYDETVEVRSLCSSSFACADFNPFAVG
jgi:deoxyribodipyrimidine photo-lyase